MKMILFRPTFVTAGMMLQAFALLCIFMSIPSVSAAPQFGFPWKVHALDGVPEPSRFIDPSVAKPSGAPPGGDHAGSTPPSGVPDAHASNSSSNPLVLDQSSGASHHLGGVHLALAASAAASAVFLVF